MSNITELCETIMDIWRQNCAYVSAAYAVSKNNEISHLYSGCAWIDFFTHQLTSLDLGPKIDSMIIHSTLEYIENNSVDVMQPGDLIENMNFIIEHLEYDFYDISSWSIKYYVINKDLFGEGQFDEVAWTQALHVHAGNIFWAILIMTLDFTWMEEK